MSDKLRPRYPDVEVEFVGQSGNADYIIGTVSMALRRSGVSSEDIAEFQRQATSGSYDHLLRTCMEWVAVI